MFLRWVVPSVFFLIATVATATAKVPGGQSLDNYRFLAEARAISFGRMAPTPIGYYQLCKAKHSVCRQAKGNLPLARGGIVRLDAQLAAQLISVNIEVNRSISPRRNPIWQVAPKSGDCKDFALTKKHRLMAAGWPSSAVLIATAFTAGGEEHAVLIVRTDHGDLVLDNLTMQIRGWTPTLYRWQSVQSPTQQWGWLRIRGATMQFADGANTPTKAASLPPPKPALASDRPVGPKAPTAGSSLVETCQKPLRFFVLFGRRDEELRSGPDTAPCRQLTQFTAK